MAMVTAAKTKQKTTMPKPTTTVEKNNSYVSRNNNYGSSKTTINRQQTASCNQQAMFSAGSTDDPVRGTSHNLLTAACWKQVPGTRVGPRP